MAIPEDIVDLWSEFPMQLKIEPLDDLFDSSFTETPEEKIYEASLVDDNAADSPDGVVTDTFEEVKTPQKPPELKGEATPKKKVYEASLADDNAADSPDGVVTDSFEEVKTPQKPQERKGVKALEVLGSDNTVVGGIHNPSKLYAYEDFHSFLAREGGLNEDRLSRLIDDVSPKPDEDFVSFLARSIGIKDEQMINRLRQALKLEPVIEFKNGGIPERPVKMEVDLDLRVREGEDAASFFVRAGSWASASSILEELASVGLDDYADEDAESFFRRTESTEDNDPEGLEEYLNGSRPAVASVALIDTPKQEVDVSSPIEQQTSVQVSGSPKSASVVLISTPKQEVEVSSPKEEKTSVQVGEFPKSGDSIPANNNVVVKKRKSSDE